MYVKLFTLLLVGLLVAFSPCYGNATEEIHMRSWGVQQGLSHQTVNAFYQDEAGFLWIGTQDGLNRFDGLHFEIFRPEKDDPSSIKINNIRQITGNSEGLLFIRGLQSITVYDLRKDQFSILRDGDVTGMCYADSALWVTTRKEIYRYENLSDPPKRYFTFESDQRTTIHINNVLVLHDGTVAVGTTADGVFFIDHARQISRNLQLGAINSISEDNNGNLWIATRDRGLTTLFPDGKTVDYRVNKTAAHTINDNNVRSVIQISDSLLYVGTYGGLQRLNKFTGQFTDYTYNLGDDDVGIRSIISMYYDRAGTLWIGTFYQGIQYYSAENDTYRFYRSASGKEEGYNPYIISSIAEDRDGRVWFGSEGDGLRYYDKKADHIYPLKKLIPAGLSFPVVKSLYYDRDDNTLWVASLHQGVDRIDLSTGSVNHISEDIVDVHGRSYGKAYNPVKMMAYPGRDSLLIASKSGILILDKRRLQLYPFTYDAAVPAVDRPTSQVWDMAVDHAGKLWVITSLNLMQIDLSGSQLKKYGFSALAGNNAQYNFTHMLFDKTGRLWLGSSGAGIFLFDDKKNQAVNYGAQHGLESGFITGLAESATENFLYIATNEGFSKFDAETNTFQNFNSRNHFPLTNVNEGGFYITHDGEIFICGLSDIVSIPAGKLKRSKADYDVFIDHLLVDNKEVRPQDPSGLITESMVFHPTLVLPPKYSSVTFAFTTNILNNHSGVELEYKLENFDKTYIPAGDNTRATYTNLPPGQYVFHVRGKPERGFSGPVRETAFAFTVEAPIYLRLWFIALAAVCLISVVAYIVRMFWVRKSLKNSLRAEQREKAYREVVNQSKLNFFTNVSHEFRTPLTLISGQLELLLMHKDLRPGLYNRILDIYKNSKRMNNLVDEVLDINAQEQGYRRLRITREDIVSIVEEIYHSFRNYAVLREIDLRFHSSLKAAAVYLDKAQIEKVFYNLLSNAFKYTKAGDWIAVEITASGEEEIVVAVDNLGVGIEPANVEHVFEPFWHEPSGSVSPDMGGSGIGLSLTKGIVEQHKGTITVESEPGGVTSFKVSLCRNANKHRQTAEAPYLPFTERDTPEKIEITELVKPDKRIKVLIVEDEPEMRRVLSELFDPIYEVHTAINGKEGLLTTTRLQPDIVISDIMMPEMSGLEMCKRLKSDLATSHIPVILLTARGREEQTLEGLQLGADDYISKPFSVKILVARTDNMIQNRKLLQQRFSQGDELAIDRLPINPIDQQLLKEAIAALEQNISNVDFDVAAFARELNLSRTLLFSKLKALTGQTPNDFMLSIRLKKAAERLRTDPDIPVWEISMEYGFSSSSYFIRCFKKAYDATPAAYRRQFHG